MELDMIRWQAATNKLPLVSVPDELKNYPIPFTDNSKVIFEKRYSRKDKNGKPAETPQETIWRVAYYVAAAEYDYGWSEEEVVALAKKYFTELAEWRIVPNSPTWTGAGTPLGQLSACFVLKIEDNMGDQPQGIFDTLRDAALIQKTGGGLGFSFSDLRSSGTLVESSMGIASGPISFMKVYNDAFMAVQQGGARRGANMGVLNVSHPDIEAFIDVKSDEKTLTNFNISVGITDDFMNAVKNNENWNLIDPHSNKITKTLPAVELWKKIYEHAYKYAEPGLLFLDTANKRNPFMDVEPYKATNPCGEEWLNPFDSCCLASINLAKIPVKIWKSEFSGKDKTFLDWEELKRIVKFGVRFLDNVITANAYVDAVPELKQTSHSNRRIGLGIMGFGDLLYKLGIRYGSPEACEFASQLEEWITYNGMMESVEIAKEKGSFPRLYESIYSHNNFKFTAFKPLEEYSRDFDRDDCDWDHLISQIKKHGIRNCEITTIVPTGTTSTVAGVSAYGCEPVFALAYKRYVEQNNLELNYVEPLFQEAINHVAIPKRPDYLDDVLKTGTCQNVEWLPENIRNTFVVSSDLTAEEHVRMQAAFQAFTMNAISKTINFPSTATPEDVAKAYMLAWELGCKGITVYVAGSRDKVVLETAQTKQDKNSTPVVNTFTKNGSVTVKRPTITTGKTISTESPVGKVYLTINSVEDQPFETFVNVAKSGTEIAAVAEAIGRLISLNLRLNDDIDRNDRLVEVMHQLENIGSTNQIRNGHKKMISSLPAAIAFAIDKYIESANEGKLTEQPDFTDYVSDQTLDICPQCGNPSLVKNQGCATCRDCGYAKC